MRKLWIVIGIVVITIIGIVLIVTHTKKEPEEIKIGAIVPLTGSFAAYGEPVRNGMLLAMEEINNSGGIRGSKLKLVIEDDGGEPKNSVNAFNKLAVTDRVPIILGPLSSGSSMATASLADRNKVVQISTLAGIPDLSEAGDYVFRIYPSSELGARFVAEEAVKRFDPDRVAILYANNPFGQTSKKIYEGVAKEKGIEVVAVESFSEGDQDFRTQLTKIKNASPDLILCSTYWVEGAKILVQMIELGLKIPIIGEDGWRGPIAKIVGEKGLNLLYFADIAFGAEFQSNQVMQDFVKKYQMKYGDKATTHAAAGYDALRIAKEAIEKVGYDSESIKNFLYQMDYTGALGNIKYNEKGDNVGVKFALFQLSSANEAIIVK